MGICCSYYGRTTPAAAVKLILLDGALQEFSSPIKVSLVLPPNGTSFICSADEIDFDVYVSAISMEEELRQGQLYFELPSSWLTRRMGAGDMASLTVKASAALSQRVGTGGGVVKFGCCIKRVDPYFELTESPGTGGSSDGSRGGGGRERKLNKSLSVIMEE